MKLSKNMIMATVSIVALTGANAFAQDINIESATATHAYGNYPASNTIDGDTAWSSSWVGFANPEQLTVDLGSDQTIDDVHISWGGGSNFSYPFEIEARRGTSGSWTSIVTGIGTGDSGGYSEYDVADMTARQIRITGTDDGYTNISEVKVFGPGSSTPTPAPSSASELTISDVNGWYDDFTHPNYPDTNTVDGSSLSSSRWANNAQPYQQIVYTLPSNQNVGQIGIEWGGAAKRTYEFEVYTRTGTSGEWGIYDLRTTSVLGDTGEQFYDLDLEARQIRVKILSNSMNDPYVHIKEVRMYGAGEAATPTPTPSSDFNLDPTKSPWENFDLSHWKLDTPAGESSSSDCDAQATEPFEYTNFPSRSEPYFFTHTDGGMRFVTSIGGATTGGSCSSFTRSELREMLRGNNTSIDTTGKNGDYRNNWALEYQPASHSGNSNESWGARGGRLTATLRVNEVTTSGSNSQVGRVIIGQIHANQDEPIRLYYRHREGQDTGCIYFASEERLGDDVDFFMIGNESCTSGPSNGIALGELFSYEIENVGDEIRVVIRRGDSDGPIIETEVADLGDLNQGYDIPSDWMYFKAGAYTQNNSGDDGDGDVVTFYRLNVEH